MDGPQTDLRSWLAQTASKLWTENKWVLPLIAAFVTSVLNPFGFSDATDARSHLVFNRIAAPFYEPAGYNRIAVVLLDDDYLTNVGDTYPMSRYNYLDIHASIVSGQPQAIFYDFHLPDNRGDADATTVLGSEIAATASNPKGDTGAAGTGPAIWFADFGGKPEDVSRYDLMGQVNTLPVRTVGVPLGEYAPCLGLEGKAVNCEAPGARTSPALAMYRDWCTRAGDPACAQIPDGDVMVLQWSRKPEPGRPKCSPDPDSLLGDVVLAARIVGQGFLKRDATSDELRQICYPFQTIRAQDFARMDEKALAAAFKDQFVLVGGLFNDAPDTTISPVHGQLPGVFVHATALENLLAFGNHYWRADRKPGGFFLGFKHIAELFALLLATLIFFYASRYQRAEAKRADALASSDPAEMPIALRRFGSALLWFLVLLVAIIGAALVVPILLNMPPTNFYGLLALTLPLMVALVLASFSNWVLVSAEKGVVGQVVLRANQNPFVSVAVVLLVLGILAVAILM